MTVRVMRWLIAATFLTGLYGSASAQVSSTIVSTTARGDSLFVTVAFDSVHIRKDTVWRTDTLRLTDTLWRDTVAAVPLPVPVVNVVKLFTGLQTVAFDNRSAPYADNTATVATGAEWKGTIKYVAQWYGKGHGTWRGGKIKGTWPQTTTSWDNGYHSFTGLIAGWEYPVVDGLYVENYGDPVRFNDPAVKSWVQRYCWYSDMHDDGLGENDRQKNGLIEYCLADGVYVGYSQRRGSDWTDNGGANTVTMRNVLVRLKPFALTATTPNTSGGFFKMDSRTPSSNPKIVLEDCVFRADAKPGTGSLELNPYGKVTAKNCVIVWLGSGGYPHTLPPGWTLTRDSTVWTKAVAALKARPDWKARHP